VVLSSDVKTSRLNDTKICKEDNITVKKAIIYTYLIIDKYLFVCVCELYIHLVESAKC